MNDLWIGQKIVYLYRKTESVTELKLGFVLPRIIIDGLAAGTIEAMLFGNGAYRQSLDEARCKELVSSLASEGDWCALDRCPYSEKWPA